MHDIRSGAFLPQFDRLCINAGIGFHGTLIHTVIIPEITISITSGAVRTRVKIYIIINQCDLTVQPFKILLYISGCDSVGSQCISFQRLTGYIQCHIDYIITKPVIINIPDFIIVLF